MKYMNSTFNRKQIMKYIILISSILTISGCANFSPKKAKGVIFERDGVSTLLISSDMREVYFKDQQSLERHCRAPDPDFTIESSSGVSIGATFLKKSEEIGETKGQTALALGGRSPAVLLTRELMYRACELSLNLNANKEMSLSIYYRFLQTIEKSFEIQTKPQIEPQMETGTNEAAGNANTPQLEGHN